LVLSKGHAAAALYATMVEKGYFAKNLQYNSEGAHLDKMMAELFGRKTGYCKGKGGSMHIADFSIGVVGAIGVEIQEEMEWRFS